MHMRLTRTYLLAALCFLLQSCSHKPTEKRYPLDGRVVAVDPSQRQLTLAHHDVPGLMKGMTMPFTVSSKDTWIFQAIAPGDQVHATPVLGNDAELEDVSFSKVSNNSVDGSSQLHIPQPVDDVPDITLINQSGNRISLRQFRGKPLLLTFIYTHCPFPDYCLRMSANFGKVLRQLQQNPAIFNQASSSVAQHQHRSGKRQTGRPAGLRRKLCWANRS
jgi:protein SCO1/2